MTNGTNLYESRSYCALALDPIHVGTGGYRLGQVDLTILREPGTRLPKIPGSSLEGTARAYTAMHYQKYRRPDESADRPGYDMENQAIREPGEGAPEAQAQAHTFKSCAGKGGEDGSDHCGRIDCPVCVPYGFTIGPENRSFHGMAQFYDARVLFFPVHSMFGPVWVTSAQTLKEAGYDLPEAQQVTGDGIRTAAGLVPPARANRRRGLNLGWLFLDVANDADLDTAAIWTGLDYLPGELAEIQQRLVLLPDRLFSLVVNDNLEVRTSVSIDPATGAAKDKALFTYEALPRGTVFHLPVIYQNPQHYVFPQKGEQGAAPTPFGPEQNAAWVRDRVEAGLRLMKHLGVGGMGTRGFGRLQVFFPHGQEGGH